MISFVERRPELEKEWDYNKNEINPSDVSFGSARKYWWICPICGNDYLAAVCHRVRGTACPECSKERKTSFGEQTIYYYLSKIFKTCNRWNDVGSEVDVFLPELNLGIEYDGEFFHFGEKSLEREKKKYKHLNELGIKLIRVKENTKNDKLISYSDFTIEINSKHWDDELKNVVYKIIEFINYNWNLNYELDVDIERDRHDIYSQYVKLRKENSFINLYPDLVNDWDYSKNKIKPETLTPGSIRIVWWKCSKGHSYSSSLHNHIKGHGCPYCTNLKVLPGYNDLLTRYPDIAKEWDNEKNGRGADSVLPFTNKRYYWKCKKGHSYRASPNARCSDIKHAGCPICSGRKVLVGYNDLATIRPNLVKEWDYDKNKKSPCEYTIASNAYAWWKCDKGHSFRVVIHSRARLEKGTGCPICAGQKLLIGYNDFKSQRPDLLVDWDFNKNNEMSTYPDSVYVSSEKKVWWKCHICGYEWKTSLYKRCKENQGCRNCAKFKWGQMKINGLIKKQGSLKDNYPEITKEWDYENNSITPDMVTAGSHKRVFWICSKCGFKWSSEIRERTLNNRVCSNCKKKSQ